MNYRYNYNYLKKWLSANKINKRDILNALETTDYYSLSKWLNGKTQIPLNSLIRLCNTFQIPISMFFYDIDGPSETIFINSGEEYKEREYPTYENSKGGPRTLNPQAKFIKETVIPGLPKDDNIKQQELPTTPIKVECKENKENTEVEILKLKLSHHEEMYKLEQEYKKREDEIRLQFDKLYQIIENQTKELKYLHSQYSIKNNDYESSIVSEPPAI